MYARRALSDEWLAAVRLRPSRLSEFSSTSLHLQGFSARLVVGADTDDERQPHDDGGSAVTDDGSGGVRSFAKSDRTDSSRCYSSDIRIACARQIHWVVARAC